MKMGPDIYLSGRPLVAVSRPWQSLEVNDRYSAESRRRIYAIFNNPNGCKRPEAALGAY